MERETRSVVTAGSGGVLELSCPPALARRSDVSRPRPSGPVRVLELRSVRGTGGGPEKTILLGAVRADPSRVVVTICYLRDGRDRVFEIDKRAKAAGVDYVEIVERNSFDRGIWPALRRLVRERRIDVVHAHDYKTDLLAYLLAHAEGIVPLSTVHGWGGISWRERFIYYPVDLKLLARFPRVVAVSRTVKRRLIDAGLDDSRVDVVPNGVDADLFRRDDSRRGSARAAFGLGPDDFAIGGVGRLEYLKRFDVLIDAVSTLLPQHPRIRLLIAGDGGARRDLEARIASLGLADRCRLIGQCRDVSEFHHALDLFVQSSADEASPNVILEAMALETPIVATAVGGTCELMRPGMDGIAVTEISVGAITDGIRRVLQNLPLARARAATARQRVERDLSFEMRVQTMDGIYAALAANRAAGESACVSSSK